MTQAAGWAIFNRHGEPVIGSFSKTRSAAITWLIGGDRTKTQRRCYWSRWKNKWGFSVRKVIIQEYTDGDC